MVQKKVVNIILRPKRQVTLPKYVCELLRISTGDVLELTVENASLIARPKKARSLIALKEIRRVFQRSGITEEELLKKGRTVRQSIVSERHGSRA
jgi:bifunctional DNA-binding transcriptional regulator/antitoxin component of YhaV-PrlF toxin-antitoxin module